MTTLTNPPEPPDAIDATRPKDVSAESLIATHQVAVWRYLRVLGCPPDLADDLCQDTFVTVLSKDRSVPFAHDPRRYLLGTARHLWLRRQRDDRNRARLLADAADRLWQVEGDDDTVEPWLDALRDCTEQLSGRARTCVETFYGARSSRRDTAAVLGMKENGLKTLLQRVRHTLRECIQRKLKP